MRFQDYLNTTFAVTVSIVSLFITSVLFVAACNNEELQPTVKTESEVDVTTTVVIRIETDLCDKVPDEEFAECTKRYDNLFGWLEDQGFDIQNVD